MKSTFSRALHQVNNDPAGRKWLFVSYDQLSDKIGPLARDPADRIGIILVENTWKPARRPYHKQKLAVILANLRHFALEQARRGVSVHHLVIDGPYRNAFDLLPAEFGLVTMMEPAEREMRIDLQPIVDAGKLQIIPHEGWLTTSEDFQSFAPEPPWRMDSFYRKTRHHLNVMIKDGKPEGGKFSFDNDNRERWSGNPPAPDRLLFPLDEIKIEVGDLIEKYFNGHPGKLDLTALPGTECDADVMWSWVKNNCLSYFGPYEDAMSTNSTGLFHSRTSTLVNICRLLPSQMVADVVEMDIPISSKEGFIRQLVGWREFMHHVHVATDGFRSVRSTDIPVLEKPDDGGYRLWSGSPWLPEQGEGEPDGGAAPSALDAHKALPPAFWGSTSGLHCLDHVVQTVWEEGWSHHITRLMILSNIAALLDVEPRQLTDWFWVAYTDAYDWVVEPNVLAMSTFALKNLATTKPYVCGAAYINKMSDYCKRCQFDPGKNCPITNLYWAYLERHAEQLEGNQRLAMPYQSLKKRDRSKRAIDQRVYEFVSDELMEGRSLTPDTVASAVSVDKKSD